MSKTKNSNGYLGVTEPISLNGPTEKDLMQSAEVEKVGIEYQINQKKSFHIVFHFLQVHGICFNNMVLSVFISTFQAQACMRAKKKLSHEKRF